MTASTTNNPLCNSCKWWVDYIGCRVKNNFRDRNRKKMQCTKFLQKEKRA